jgi:hypothetical protein
VAIAAAQVKVGEHPVDGHVAVSGMGAHIPAEILDTNMSIAGIDPRLS